MAIRQRKFWTPEYLLPENKQSFGWGLLTIILTPWGLQRETMLTFPKRQLKQYLLLWDCKGMAILSCYTVTTSTRTQTILNSSPPWSLQFNFCGLAVLKVKCTHLETAQLSHLDKTKDKQFVKLICILIQINKLQKKSDIHEIIRNLHSEYLTTLKNSCFKKLWQGPAQWCSS